MKQRYYSFTTFRNFLLTFGILVAIIFYLFRLEGLDYGYFVSVASIIALGSILYALKSVIGIYGDSNPQLGFKFIFFGILFSFISFAIWLFFTIVGKQDLANSISSYFFIATYILNFTGYLILGIVTRIKLREFFPLIIVFGLIGLNFLTIAQDIHPNTFSLISSGYLIGDIFRMIVIALIVQMVIVYQGGSLGRFWLSILIGNIFIFVSNFTASIFLDKYTAGIWPYTLIDLTFIYSYLIVASGFYGIFDSIRLAQEKISKHLPKK